MEQRRWERLGRDLGVVGLGCWQLGAGWGAVSEDDAMATLHAAADAGVTCFDTADVYGDGRSERLVGRMRAERIADEEEPVFIATKMGRRANPHVPEAFTLEAFRAWGDRSRANLDMDTLDLVQLHCPPPSVLDSDQIFDALDELVQEGRIAAYGVSVETCAEALAAISRPGVVSVQIILNAFRPKPLEEVLPAAAAAGVAIIARVPLASGLLTGRYDESTTFPAEDHRAFNRHGDAFDVGETFSGVPYEVGVQAAREIAALTPPGWSTAQLALRWVLDQPGVSVVIPGARNPAQALDNVVAAHLDPLPQATLTAMAEIYDHHIREHIHARW